MNTRLNTNTGNKIVVKCIASVLFVIILSLILCFVKGYTTFAEGFGYGFLLWTIVNAYDAIVLDIIWFAMILTLFSRGQRIWSKSIEIIGFT